jgi:hypothetical protein
MYITYIILYFPENGGGFTNTDVFKFRLAKEKSAQTMETVSPATKSGETPDAPGGSIDLERPRQTVGVPKGIGYASSHISVG